MDQKYAVGGTKLISRTGGGRIHFRREHFKLSQRLVSWLQRFPCSGYLGHSSCLESFCGDFLHIAVLFVGAMVRYVCTSSTCNDLGK